MPAYAAQADAREIARINNCSPKKIEVISQTLGQDSQTLYRVECSMPKMTGDVSANTATALIVRCDGAICAMLRALSGSEQK